VGSSEPTINATGFARRGSTDPPQHQADRRPKPVAPESHGARANREESVKISNYRLKTIGS